MSRQILHSSPADRQRWMSVLAKAPVAALEGAWMSLVSPPTYVFLRQPEAGLIMVRGRTGGTGQPFNLGEMTMTRCAVRLAGGQTGFGHVAGRDHRKAELAAVFDGLMQDPDRRGEIEHTVIALLETKQSEIRAAKATAVAASKVDFFTMVRGE
jgi:alpha-D-ribose 1-methylphosphonate 5-triphosphate synthase subunit PhnG